MAKKNWQSVLPEQDRFRLRTSRHLKTLKGKLPILLKMVLSRDFKLALKILMTSFQLTLVNLLQSLVYRLAASPILSTKWLLDTIRITVGKQHLLRQKMHQHISTHIK